MSCFINSKFTKELAYRTMVNYYNLRDFKPQPADSQSPELKRVLMLMKACNFETTQHYEVTLALNSLIGLLILPQQEYFEKINNINDFRALPKLKAFVDNNCTNTYTESKEKPAYVLKHMRNSIAHNRVMIIPETGYNHDITHVRFRDAAYSLSGGHKETFNSKYNLDTEIAQKKAYGYTVYEFDIRIPAENLESVLMEVAEYLIGFAE